MDKTTYIESLSDSEIIFLKKFRLNEYLPDSQEEILTEIKKRNLENKELEIIQNIEFNKSNTGCPRCNSHKISTAITDTGATGGSLALVVLASYTFNKQSTSNDTKETQKCMICGFRISGENSQYGWLKKLIRRVKK